LSFASIQETCAHEDAAHLVWVCIHCKFASTHSSHALTHIRTQHRTIVVAEAAIKALWMAHRPAGSAFLMEWGSCVDLDRPLAKSPFEEARSPTNTGLVRDNENPPEHVKAAMTRYLRAHMMTLNVFLTEVLPPDDVKGRQLADCFSQQIQSLLGRADEDKPWANAGTASTVSGRLSSVPSASASAQPTPPFADPNSKPAFFGPSTYEARRPHRESTWHAPGPQVPTAGEASEPRPRLRRRTPSGSFEPVQEMSLPGEKQRQYYLQMQDCIVETAFGFYIRHQKVLDSVTDRKGRKLCCATAGHVQITSKNDLTLPQWTRLLRRLSDAKGIQRSMVSHLESFNGEIQPVDEVRHACSKKKEKSDRDLLALVQATRCFCWQLRDWEKCEQLDDLYGTIEARIALAKSEELRMQSVGAELPRRMVSTRTTWRST